MRQQHVPKLAVPVRDVAPVDFVEQDDERRACLLPVRRHADECLQRCRADARVPPLVPDDLRQQLRYVRQRAGRRAQDEEDEALVFPVATRLAQDLPQQRVEIGRHECPGSRRRRELGEMGRLTVQHFQQPALVVLREAPCVPVQGNADRVAVDQLATIGGASAQRRQPPGEPSERRHDLAVAARDQRQDAPHRQSVLDQVGDVSRGQDTPRRGGGPGRNAPSSGDVNSRVASTRRKTALPGPVRPATAADAAPPSGASTQRFRTG